MEGKMISVFMNWIWMKLHVSERGQDVIEYALLSGLIAAALIAVGLGVYTGAVESMAMGISRCVDFESSTTCEFEV
jgi:Flp pilus assembly pilin Flp